MSIKTHDEIVQELQQINFEKSELLSNESREDAAKYHENLIIKENKLYAYHKRHSRAILEISVLQDKDRIR